MHHLRARGRESERRGTGVGEQAQHHRTRWRDPREPSPLVGLFEEHAELAGRRRPHLERQRGRSDRHLDLPGIGQLRGELPGAPRGAGAGGGPFAVDRHRSGPGGGQSAPLLGLRQGPIHQHPAEPLQAAAAARGIDAEIDDCRVPQLSSGWAVHDRRRIPRAAPRGG